jgi:hypothetical protein
MGTTLYFRPVLPKTEKALDDRLKYILKEKFHIDQGTVRLNRSNLDYIQGLSDAGVPGASYLNNAILKYEAVDVWIV